MDAAHPRISKGAGLLKRNAVAEKGAVVRVLDDGLSQMSMEQTNPFQRVRGLERETGLEPATFSLGME